MKKMRALETLSVSEENPKLSEPLPVYQRPESIVFGVFSVLMTSSFAANVYEIADKGMSDGTTTGVIATAYGAAATGWNALRSHRDTVAYNNASEEERNSPRTIGRRHFVRSMRTIAWGGATVISGELGLIEVVNAVETENTLESLAHIGGAGVAAAVGTKAFSGLRNSRRKQKELKELWKLHKANQPDNLSFFVSSEYQEQLDDLASRLITPERFNKQLS